MRPAWRPAPFLEFWNWRIQDSAGMCFRQTFTVFQAILRTSEMWQTLEGWVCFLGEEEGAFQHEEMMV